MIDRRAAALYGRYYLSFLVSVEERVGVISICIDGLCFLYFTSFLFFFSMGGGGRGCMSVCEAISLQILGGRGGGRVNRSLLVSI